MAQKLSSMILGLRRKVNIKVRQPLNKIMLPVPDNSFREQVERVKSLVLNEVNVKEIEYISDTAGILVKRIKPNFKTLGPRFGKLMKEIGAVINAMEQEQICSLKRNRNMRSRQVVRTILLTLEDVEIISEDIPGWLVANEGTITVALDINITEELRQEGVARELVNRIQNIRKESGFDVTDKINVIIQKHEVIKMPLKYTVNILVHKHLQEQFSWQTGWKVIAANVLNIDDDVFIKISVSRI